MREPAIVAHALHCSCIQAAAALVRHRGKPQHSSHNAARPYGVKRHAWLAALPLVSLVTAGTNTSAHTPKATVSRTPASTAKTYFKASQFIHHSTTLGLDSAQQER